MLFANGLDKRTKLLLLCGPVGCILSITVFLVLGTTTPNYSAFRHPVSSLALSEAGWIQTANFIIAGIFILAFAFGLRRSMPYVKGATLTSVIIGLVGIGLIGTGAFTTDPIYGYPTTQPLLLKQFSTEGQLHKWFSYVVLFGLPVTCLRFRKRFKQANDHLWASYSLLTAIAIFAGLILSGIGFKQVDGLVHVAGFFQRLSIIIGCTWLTLLSFYILKTARWHERVARTPFHTQ